MRATAANVPLWRRLRRAGHVSADRVLDLLGIDDPPVDVEWIARRLGAVVAFSPALFTGELDSQADPPVIVVNSRDGRERQRFTIAHELGHLLLHESGNLYRDVSFSGPGEIEANKFAADLLMPMWMLDPFSRRYRGDVGALARIFQVSEQAMRIRLGRMTGYL